ncbi:MAG: glutaredoxin family protein [Polaromonas sp.]|nr:glutaredoxin family protein [Polaromonas sp.]
MLVRFAALVTFAALLASAAQAQVYRIVGADGKVSFSDQPPLAANGAKALATEAGTSGPVVAALPFGLRQVASKFPVTLYTSDSCGPCDAGRSMLTSRGIPFAERTINTNADSEALKRLSNATSLPLLTIGSQHLKGYSDAEWTQFLDAAGYPPKSSLPSAYRRPEARPLVIAIAPPAAAPPAAVPAAPKAAAPPVNAPASPPNPAGIRF